jgi:hypothetical protein
MDRDDAGRGSPPAGVVVSIDVPREVAAGAPVPMTLRLENHADHPVDL